MDRPDRDDRRDVPDGGYRAEAGTTHATAESPARPLEGLVARTLVVTALLLLGAGLVFLLGVFLWAQANDGRVVLYTNLYSELGMETVLLYAVVTPIASVGLALLTLHLEHSA